jgi:hypothetical protein
MRTSRFISLAPYCVVEYMFDQLGSLEIFQDNFILVENEHIDGRQIFNLDGSYSSTKNIQDLTVVPIGENRYAYLDSEKIPNYLTFDSKLTTAPINGYNVVMDKVRFHFVAGFNLDDFSALVLNITHTENSGRKNIFANILLAPETYAELVAFNPRPLFLSNSTFDRYVDILIPSIKNINEDYRTALNPSTTFAAAITPSSTGSIGFIYNSPISIGLAECEKRKTIFSETGQKYDAFEISEFFEASVSQTNEFDNVGAFINESTVGDYIEFYLTFNSGFPADLIGILNRRNPSDDWIIIHQISVFEQIGTSFLNTSRFVFFQEENFDEPNVFRPVLRNANEAVSMSIDYLVRLTNRRNGEQIIREGSFSLISPKKYGRKLTTIPLLDKPQSQRIYNKIIKNNFEASSLFVEPVLDEDDTTPIIQTQFKTIIQTEYVPIFFNNSNISVSNPSVLIKTSDSTEAVIFGKGKLRFILSPFDNIVKLKVYTTSVNNEPSPLDLNVNGAKYKLVFDTDSGKIGIDNAADSAIENLSSGLIVFNISKKDSETVSKSKNRVVYLVSVSQDGRETLIYNGEWRKPSEQKEVDSAIAQIIADRNANLASQNTLNQINQSIRDNTKQLDKVQAIPFGRVKPRAITSIVNRFAANNSISISPNSRNTKPS